MQRVYLDDSYSMEKNISMKHFLFFHRLMPLSCNLYFFPGWFSPQRNTESERKREFLIPVWSAINLWDKTWWSSSSFSFDPFLPVMQLAIDCTQIRLKPSVENWTELEGWRNLRLRFKLLLFFLQIGEIILVAISLLQRRHISKKREKKQARDRRKGHCAN